MAGRVGRDGGFQDEWFWGGKAVILRGLGVGLNIMAYLSGLYVRTATFRFPDERVAAVRGLEKPDHRPKPADPKVFRAQPP